MQQLANRKVKGILVLLLLSAALCGITAAAEEPDYSVTHTITVSPDGSALWRVEYRTLLLSEQDTADFDAYTRDLSPVYIPQFRDLMEKSAAQAAVATGRHMTVADVSGTAAVQTAPTGQYGVVVYALRWEGFAAPGPVLVIGDAFAGGLYLAKGNTLIVRYPEGWGVQAADPAPDENRNGLVWYGQRSFGAGEPRIVLEQPAFPFLPVAVALFLVVVIAFAGFYVYRRKQHEGGEDAPGLKALPLSGEEIASLEERIVRLLTSQGNEMFQSDIVRNLGLPKSTVSAALNSLHAKNQIVKVRKGRENLIRLI
jgi:uncharacterized membrane protein